MRLLFCSHCKTCEEVPDIDGPEASDRILNALIERHAEREPMEHGGERLQFSPFRVGAFTDHDWATNPDNCLKLAAERNKADGFNAWVYEARSTYGEDALRCFSRHHRPTEGCIDYRDDSKIIGRPTQEGRSAMKDMYKLAKSDPSICDYCPVHVWVTTKIRTKQGLYQ